MGTAEPGRFGTSMEEDGISVLLVDDNERWAKYITGEIEKKTQGFKVSLAFSANEAMVSMQDESFDCVVADYHMPEADGIQLLENVRQKDPDLPFILVTGEGSENVASEAIEEGVTDYIKKDPRADQISLFINRIEQAVNQYRLRQRIEESEQRYRTVTEQTQEAILILQKGTVRFCNERLSEITGVDRDAVLRGGISFIDEVIHEKDREKVRETLDEWRRKDTGGGLDTTRFITEDGDTRYCEYTGRPITYSGEPATLLSVRDVTPREKRRRKRRQRRELNKRVQQTLIESQTRGELESSIIDHLQGYGYDLVWVGEGREGDLHTRSSTGDDRYADELRLTVGGEHGSEPRVSASQSGEPQFIEDFESLLPTDWSQLAVECGYRSGAALPLVHEGISYGVLAVYSKEPGGIGEIEREVLCETADILALSIHNLESKRALTSDSPVDVELEVGSSDYYLVGMLSSPRFDVSSAEVRVTGTHPDSEGNTVQYVTLTEVSPEGFNQAAADNPAVKDVSVISQEDAERVQLTVEENTPESELGSVGAVVRSTTVTPNKAVLQIELPGKKNLGSLVETLEDEYRDVSVVSCTETNEGFKMAGRLLPKSLDLTEKQEVALEAAYRHGYFEQPRDTSASDIAESLDITHSTYLQHLRIAQKKVFERLYG